MERVGLFVLMVKAANGFLRSIGAAAEAGEEKVFLVGRVACAAQAEVVQCRVDGRRLFGIESTAASTIRHCAENLQKVFDAAMAILQHAERVIESAVAPGSDLNGHWSLLLSHDAACGGGLQR